MSRARRTSHHRSLRDLAEPEVREELERSRAEISERVGRCDRFAYPFGNYSSDIAKEAERAGYHRTAVTTQSDSNRRGIGRFVLRRQIVSRTTGARRFRRKVGAW